MPGGAAANCEGNRYVGLRWPHLAGSYVDDHRRLWSSLRTRKDAVGLVIIAGGWQVRRCMAVHVAAICAARKIRFGTPPPHTQQTLVK